MLISILTHSLIVDCILMPDSQLKLKLTETERLCHQPTFKAELDINSIRLSALKILR